MNKTFEDLCFSKYFIEKAISDLKYNHYLNPILDIKQDLLELEQKREEVMKQIRDVSSQINPTGELTEEESKQVEEIVDKILDDIFK